MAKIENKYNVLFFPDKEKTEPTAENVFIETDKTGEKKYYNFDAKLRVRIRWSAGVLNFNLGERVELAKWSTDTQFCINGTSHGKKKRTAKDINEKIKSVQFDIETIFREFAEKNIIPTIEKFRNRYNKTTNEPEKEKSFFDYFDEFVKTESNQNNWKESTHEKLSAVKKHYKAFETISKYKYITFDTFDKDGLNAFVSYLRDKKEMRNSTILKQVDILKWFLKWAKNAGYNQNVTYQSFSPKLTTTKNKVIFLNWSELMTVYNFDFSTAQKTLPDGTVIDLEDENKKALERVRDVFCFCCFSSLRYSDVENLKRTDIKNGVIEITTIKTDDTLTIELNDYSSAILAKYANEVYPNNKALPVISNQKMNDRLKEMGEVCGINTPITITYYKGAKRFDEVYPKYELITTHCGRKTFICNALMLGIAPTTVMEWTGHSDFDTMKTYIGVANEEKKKAMNLFNR
ncbi:MAG TPA: phage integrase SAM-like domain-containing protein [Flavobacterium lutivivi]|nr:phage integrase SAM-like domain-containing protein [Flavobacterium lutivivi]